jgi:hypothetical protein
MPWFEKWSLRDRQEPTGSLGQNLWAFAQIVGIFLLFGLVVGFFVWLIR